MHRNPQIDQYLREGCGRCPLGGTPECKVHDWQAELQLLRSIALDCGLTEELKWKAPCYTYAKHNVAMISALKDCATLSFFKGALLEDPHGILVRLGPNCQAARLVRFTSVQSIREREQAIKALLRSAIEVESSGKKVEFIAKDKLVFPEELERKFDASPSLRSAFEALTPGRRRGYILYFAAAKQSKTREARIEKWTPQILKGLGMHD